MSDNDSQRADTGRRWGPRPGDGDLIWAHLLRQHDLPPGSVRLDDGRVIRVGADAAGESG